VLVKALNLAPEAGPVFSGTQGTWAQSYVSTAAAYGIVGGSTTLPTSGPRPGHPGADHGGQGGETGIGVRGVDLPGRRRY